MNKRKIFAKIINNQTNVRFAEMVKLMEALGFVLDRVSGSHHIFRHPQIPEMANLQDVHGQAKPYQVRQVLQIVEQYNLALKASGEPDTEENV